MHAYDVVDLQWVHTTTALPTLKKESISSEGYGFDGLDNLEPFLKWNLLLVSVPTTDRLY